MNHILIEQRSGSLARILASCLLAVMASGLTARAGDREDKLLAAAAHSASHECHYQSPETWRAAIKAAVDRGEIADPRLRLVPPIAPRVQLQGVSVGTPTPTPADIFPFEDSAGLLLTNFSNGELFDLMTAAGNALLAAEGDNFDFIAFWVNFTPNHTLGTAFYLGLENNVTGIGRGLFNSRPAIGLGGNNVEGYVMMWNINSTFWATGNGANASFTRQVLGQEFEHRFGMFLPDLLDGRQLQGDGNSCGRGSHWNFRVDGQGSGMEIPEWIGASPAIRQNGSLNFNTDIGANDAVFSYTDLYLMGYVSPTKMDTGNSELRYLDNNTNCGSPYNGPISNFTSADIIASAGVRSPSSLTSQKDFRTAWIMIHQPGAPPSLPELTKAAGILEQWSLDWKFSTLDIGTMNNTLRADDLPEMAWQPVAADVPSTIVGNDIFVQAGGARVTLDLMVSSWAPALVSIVSGTVDSTGYTSGEAGTLAPVVTPDVSAGAFVDTGRPDYIHFEALTRDVIVQTDSLDYTWNSIAAPSVPDTGVPRYAGTLVLDVSADAKGTFTVGLLPDPASLLLDDLGELVAGLNLRPATITIAPGNTSCSVPVEIACDTATAIDNSLVFGAPDPPYPCGAQDNHDGTLWYQFTATETTARLSSCGSIAKDSTFAVYDGTCGSLVAIGCSEDEGCDGAGFLGDTNLTGLTIGETYLIQFSAWQAFDRGQYTLALNCCETAAPPQPDVIEVKNRYLSFRGGSPGQLHAMRVTAVDLPSPFDVLNGSTFWVGDPFEVSELSGKDDLMPPTSHFATLQCEPSFLDWSVIDVVHVFHEALVPGGRYDVQAIDVSCGIEKELAFSTSLASTLGRWGDVVGQFDTNAGRWLPPDAIVGVTSDVVAILDKFRNVPTAPTKSRSDIEPGVPDLKINITDVTSALDAFRGRGFPFDIVPAPCPQ